MLTSVFELIAVNTSSTVRAVLKSITAETPLRSVSLIFPRTTPAPLLSSARAIPRSSNPPNPSESFPLAGASSGESNRWLAACCADADCTALNLYVPGVAVPVVEIEAVSTSLLLDVASREWKTVVALSLLTANWKASTRELNESTAVCCFLRAAERVAIKSRGLPATAISLSTVS